MKTKTTTAERMEHIQQIIRQNRSLEPVRLGLMRVSNLVQRDLKPQRVNYLYSIFDPEMLGTPEVSHRDGYFYIMDGQHRIESLKMWLGKGWEDQHLPCWVARGLTEKDEAEVFLNLNDKLNVDAFQKFKVGVRAGREVETEIARVVTDQKLTISQQRTTPGAISAVGTLMKVFKRNGADTLSRALALARDTYGDPGLDAPIIDGFSLLCHRYNGVLDEKTAKDALAKIHGGLNGLLNAAEELRQKTGNSKPHCIAASAVQIINRHRRGKNKLPDWWKN